MLGAADAERLSGSRSARARRDPTQDRRLAVARSVRAARAGRARRSSRDTGTRPAPRAKGARAALRGRRARWRPRHTGPHRRPEQGRHTDAWRTAEHTAAIARTGTDAHRAMSTGHIPEPLALSANKMKTTPNPKPAPAPSASSSRGEMVPAGSCSAPRPTIAAAMSAHGDPGQHERRWAFATQGSPRDGQHTAADRAPAAPRCSCGPVQGHGTASREPRPRRRRPPPTARKHPRRAARSRSATTSTSATARPNDCDTSSTVTVGRRLAEVPPRKSPLP